MVILGAIVVGAADVRRAAEFWSAALHYAPRDEEPEDDWIVLRPSEGTGPELAIGLSVSPVQAHPRVHLDLFAEDARQQAAEVQRLESLGATRVDWDLYPENPDFVVLADTEGNRFCIVDLSHKGG